MSSTDSSNVEPPLEWDDGVAAARKWRVQGEISGRATNEALIRLARIRPGGNVLDLASGSGSPALDIARVVGPTGHVTATDLSSKLLAVAKEKAVDEGLSNISFQEVDMENQQLPDETFDIVTCRFGIMYARNVQRALTEMRRVLKPNGRVALVAWGPSEGDPRKTIVLEVLMKYSKSSAPDPAISLPSSFSEPGKLSRALSQAGFKQVHQEARNISFPFRGSPEQAWEMVHDGAIFFRKTIKTLTPEQRKTAGQEISRAWSKYYDGHQVNFTAPVVFATGVR
ncbi:MAG TPA: class I SAM-dependent methyltransferase [Candidatus Bathyarchaeia archaeon]|nr:class I SAM-dependent methyltransferase [Candidatus Bathyarchaeia archaeon]